jgi:long-chain acyl-CoA synthetase
MENLKLYSFLESYVQNTPTKEIFFNKIDNTWQGISASDFYNKTLQIAVSLQKLGIGGHHSNPLDCDKISIVSGNRTEWCLVDYATQQIGAALVPIYPTIHADEMAYILNDAEVKILFVSDKNLYKKVAAIKDKVPSLQAIYSFNEIEGVINYQTLLQSYSEEDFQKVLAIKNKINTTDLTTIIYTSGTTGSPKGVMLSHENIASNVNNCIDLFTMCGQDGKALSFLPLNHIFEKMVMSIYVKKGISVYFAPGAETVGDNLREVKPQLFTTVPRLLEKVYEKIEAKGAELTGAKKKIFDWSMKLAENFEVHPKPSAWYNLQRSIADKLVYSKWRAAIGGEVKAIITGSAACQMRLQKIFTCAKMVVMEGYGLTETSPVVTVNTYEEYGRSFGTIGIPIEGQEVKLAFDKEIICRGKHVMMGYFKHPELTAEAIKDGWFHTGDIGEWIDGKYLKITDRKKELFKLSAGKYIAPQLIENKMKESTFIEQIMVLGANEKFVGALIVPSVKNIIDHFAKQGKELVDKNQLVTDAEVNKLIRAELNNFNKHFSDHEHVKRFHLLPEEWTIDEGEMTPTLKLKRKVITEKYKAAIASIFNVGKD